MDFIRTSCGIVGPLSYETNQYFMIGARGYSQANYKIIKRGKQLIDVLFPLDVAINKADPSEQYRLVFPLTQEDNEVLKDFYILTYERYMGQVQL